MDREQIGGYYDTLPDFIIEHRKGFWDFVNADSAEFEDIRHLRIEFNSIADACRNELIKRYPEGRMHAIYLQRHWLSPAWEKHRKYLVNQEL
jgi:hypothetical protein